MQDILFSLDLMTLLNDPILLSMDLQRFANPEDEGRTEEPSEAKKRKAREEGNIPQSPELIGIISFLAIFLCIVLFWRFFYTNLYKVFIFYLDGIDTIRFTKNDIQGMSFNLLAIIMTILSPIFFTAVVSVLIASLAQTKFLFTTKKLAPNFKKVFGNIFSNLKKMFWSKQSIFNLGKSLAKVIIVFGIAFLFIMNELGTTISYIHMENHVVIASIAQIIVKFVFITGIILLFLAISDYVFQYREYIDSLKMTKQEVKEEFKEQEGNPEIKQKIRQLEQQLGKRRMMQAVPTADVIITNPTHYAIAIKYDRSYMNAPIIIAKGTDRTALKIREIAQDNQVPIYENKPLARGLYASVNVGDEIPYEFYKTIADILSLVYTKNIPRSRTIYQP
ncbi:MAG: flagellar biosynthesis protein FlhB [Brevinema sp.]